MEKESNRKNKNKQSSLKAPSEEET
jgi:hypothetical protein